MRVEIPSEGNERLDRVIKPEQAEALFSAAIWAAAARRGAIADERVPSLRAEALQRIYFAGFERGRKEERSLLADDGK